MLLLKYRQCYASYSYTDELRCSAVPLLPLLLLLLLLLLPLLHFVVVCLSAADSVKHCIATEAREEEGRRRRRRGGEEEKAPTPPLGPGSRCLKQP